jgi:mannose-1-phosphate guanylyltransferase
LPLAGNDPLIRQTIDRILPIVQPDHIRLLTGERLRAPVLGALSGFGSEHVLAEPIARGTAPVLAWAAYEIARSQPDAIMASLHADHVIEPAEAFHELLLGVAQHARALGKLFTIGVVPTRPETGYGYIKPGERLGTAPDAFAVERFVEKPTRAVAEEYVSSGYLWNTGLFVWPVQLLLEELRRCTPELANLLPLLEHGDVQEFFDRAPVLSIDEGLLERSERVAVVRATFQWDDVGTWDAVGRTRATDDSGNVVHGDAYAVQAEDCIAWSESGSIVLFGTHDLIVVRTADVTFVAPRERAADLKKMLEQLPQPLRDLGGN